MDGKEFLKNRQVKNIVLGISNQIGVVDLATLLDLYKTEQLKLHGVLDCKINVLVTWWNYLDSRHALLDDHRTKVSKVVEVENLTDINEMFTNIIKVKILN